MIKGLFDKIAEKRKFEPATKERVNNVGVLISSGLIAGEALLGLLFAGLAFAEVKLFEMFQEPTFLFSLVSILIIGYLMIRLPFGSVKK
jgi:hypothetical protein